MRVCMSRRKAFIVVPLLLIVGAITLWLRSANPASKGNIKESSQQASKPVSGASSSTPTAGNAAPSSSAASAPAGKSAPATSVSQAAAVTAPAPSPVPVGSRVIFRKPATLPPQEAAFQKSLIPRTPLPKEPLRIPPGNVLKISVKFTDAFAARASADGKLSILESQSAKASELEQLAEKWDLRFVTLHTVPEQDLKALEDKAAKNSGRAQPDQASLLVAVPKVTTKENVVAAARALHSSPLVEYAELESLDQPVPPPAADIAPTTPNLTSLQGYRSATNGVNVDYVWNTYGIRGHSTLRVTDCEYQFNPLHEDLSGLVTLQTGIASMYTAFGDDHATAVLGVLVAGNNSYGMTGSLPDCPTFFYPEYSNKTAGGIQDRTAAIVAAIAASAAGDIVVLEMQTGGVGDQYVPAEYALSVWNAVKTGSDAGVVVVAAAGNGNQNLDSSGYDAYRARGDSGSIIVGAGSSARAKLSFSTYGTRVNVQGWGQSVATLGYGAYATYGGDVNQEYTNSFNGTSSATPTVTSAVGLLQSFAIKVLERRLTPAEIRQILVSTGRAQTGTLTTPIGPMPELQAAINSLLVSSPPSFSTLSSWGYYHFATGSPSWTADPDSNGLANLAEYVLGTEPKTNAVTDPTKIPQITVENPQAPTRTLVYSFNQPAARTGAAWGAQMSTNPAPSSGLWGNLVHGVNGVTIVRAGDRIEVRVPDVVGSANKFFRLAVTATTP